MSRRSVRTQGWLGALALSCAFLLAGCGSAAVSQTVPATGEAQANRAPSIAGDAAVTVTAGSRLSIVPTASDPDGQALTFRVLGLPGWAAFNGASGAVTGTPANSNAGNYALTIFASDGLLESSLAVSVTVVAATTPPPPPAVVGSATLSWTPPTARTDGSALTDLAGYRIYYGLSPEALTNRVDVAGAATTTWIVNSLAAGTWYFAASAVDAGGNESALSGTASKSIA